MKTLDKLRGGLVVSCQALPDEPLHGSQVMAKMATAAIAGGAVGIRANSVADINAIQKVTSVPIIGIIKAEYPDSEVYITPTIDEVDQLVATGVEIIAVDCTIRQRPSNLDLNTFVREIKSKYPNQIFMADCSTVSEAEMAVNLGFDIISSTLVGYTSTSVNTKLCDNDYQILKSMKNVASKAGKFFIAEGNINTPEIMQYVLELGADSVVVGSMITRPQLITRKFSSKLSKEVKFIDMDGVLVDEQANIDKRTIEKLQTGKFMSIINTGRLMHDIDHVVNRYNLNSSFKIAANGAHVQARNGVDLVVHTLDNAIRDQIYKVLRGPEFANVRLEVNTKRNRYFFDQRPIDFPKEYHDSSIITDIDQIISELDVIGFLVIFDDYNKIAAKIDALAEKYQGIVTFERSSNTSLEVFSSKASKGSAIKFLKDNNYIDSSVITSAYGDSFNDVSMFQYVDKSYAIASHPEVERQADIVIEKLYEGL